MNKPCFKPDETAAWCKGKWLNRKPESITGVCADSRSIAKGNLFFALRGDKFDGHDFLDQVFLKGASCAVIANSAARDRNPEQPLLATKDTRRALLDMAKGYRQSLSLKIIAITGSAGKTTTKEMTADILAAKFPTARTKGNWNNDIGLPLSMLSINQDDMFGVMEMGVNHPGELSLLCDTLSPDIGIITQIGPVHLEHFKTVDAIAREKSLLFRSLPDNGTAIFNSDSQYAGILAEAAHCKTVQVSMRDNTADFHASMTHNGAVLFAERSGETCEIFLKAPGIHNVSNALLAVAAGRIARVEWDAIKKALEAFKPPPMRWDEREINGIIFVNDAYNANPISMRAALNVFSDMKVKGRKWLVLADMLELGETAEQEHAQLGKLAATGTWAGLITTGELGKHIANAAVSNGMGRNKVFHCDTTEDITTLLRSKVRPGDAVLIKGSRGMRLERTLQSFEKAPGADPDNIIIPNTE